MDLPDLPISEALPALLGEIDAAGMAVLQAPPGAGKTTIVPLALAESGLVAGKIVMLEPRRLAARTAAERMAETLDERPGGRIGYRIRGETRVSPATQVEVVTEGILTRMLQSDPDLPGIGAVIFDEFHERSLNADLGLALAIEARAALRPDLKLLVMSATLDAGPVARMMDAPIVTSDGRAFPVETIWIDRPPPPSAAFEETATRLVLRALDGTEGGVLVFLPGAKEIGRVAKRLQNAVGSDVHIQPLYGALPFARQRAAIQPLARGRKLVLATAIAETSLTIQDIRVVVDCGQARRARFDPGSAMSRLVTERVTLAEAAQRRGRAGRVAPGWCYRMWPKAAEGGLAAFPAPEIEIGDLTGLALELALWGAEPDQLAFVTPPSAARLAAARDLLRDLGALDADGRITKHGAAIAKMPLHPRLGHMLAQGGSGAAGLAALLSDRDQMRGAGVDLTKRKILLGAGGSAALQGEARRLARLAGPDRRLGWPELAALAYPDRIGRRRPGDQARYVLSGGRGAVMDDGDDLAAAPIIAVTDIDGTGREARIRQAVAISEAGLRSVAADRIDRDRRCEWSRRDRRILAVEAERLGAVVLAERVWADAPPDALAGAALDGFRDLGLTFSAACATLRARVEWLRRARQDMPDMSDEWLTGHLDDWLLPHLSPVPKSEAAIRSFDLYPALQSLLNWQQAELLRRDAPARFRAPTGRSVAIDYGGEAPEIAIRLQEMFGLTVHPILAGQRLRITLLSPAGRPVQTTADLPRFWENSYADVRKDMRGRYPKHVWPEDPAAAPPTTRAKPRGA